MLRPASVIALAAVAPAAFAHVPDGRGILEKAAKAAPPRIPFVLNLEEVPGASADPPRRAFRLSREPEGPIVLETEDLAGGGIDVRRFSDAKEVREGELPLDRAPAWVLWLAGVAPGEIARAKGIDVSRTALSHAATDVLVVVGAGPREADRPQLHFERATGRLRRAVDVEVSGGGTKTVRAELSGTKEGPAPAERFPARVTLLEDGARTELALTWLSFEPPPSPPPAPATAPE